MNAILLMHWSIRLLFVSALIEALTGACFFFDFNPVIGFKAKDIHRVNGLLLVALIAFHLYINR